MENSQIVLKEKLGLFGILKETIAILYRTPNFVILTLLTSLPLFCSLLPHEIFFQQTLIETAKIQQEEGSLFERCSLDSEIRLCVYRYVGPLELIEAMVSKLYGRYLLLGLSYLGIVHLLDLFTTIVIVNSASAIYAGESPMSLKERWEKSIERMNNLKGPLITSIYALILSSLSLLGLTSMVAHFYTASPSRFIEGFFSSFLSMAFFGLLSVAWLAKHMEWNAIWNMGVVISVLEEKKGTIAIGVSAYISRGCRRRGLFLMLIFFLWRLALRFSCLYIAWSGRGNGIGVTAAHVGLVCLGNVLKWVAFMVYFYDCKKRFLEKKVDVEQGTAAQSLK